MMNDAPNRISTIPYVLKIFEKHDIEVSITAWFSHVMPLNHITRVFNDLKDNSFRVSCNARTHKIPVENKKSKVKKIILQSREVFFIFGILAPTQTLHSKTIHYKIWSVVPNIKNQHKKTDKNDTKFHCFSILQMPHSCHRLQKKRQWHLRMMTSSQRLQDQSLLNGKGSTISYLGRGSDKIEKKN